MDCQLSTVALSVVVHFVCLAIQLTHRHLTDYWEMMHPQCLCHPGTLATSAAFIYNLNFVTLAVTYLIGEGMCVPDGHASAIDTLGVVGGLVSVAHLLGMLGYAHAYHAAHSLPSACFAACCLVGTSAGLATCLFLYNPYLGIPLVATTADAAWMAAAHLYTYKRFDPLPSIIHEVYNTGGAFDA
jgi:hypothetical protein